MTKDERCEIREKKYKLKETGDERLQTSNERQATIISNGRRATKISNGRRATEGG